jgi:alpha 1,2-mannosyltransferase
VFYQIAGLEGFPKDLPVTSSEAGQLLVDKSKHIKTLLLATYYNIWGPGWYYAMLSQGALGQGDKNTFETAAVVLNLPYYRVKTPVRSLGRLTGNDFKGSGMVQFHPTDDFVKYFSNADNKTVRPAFMHANTPKMNAGHLVDEGDLQDEITKEHLRLWGTKQDQDLLFGMDFEKATFQVVVDVGCKFASVVKEWKHRWSVCSRLEQHFKEAFE